MNVGFLYLLTYKSTEYPRIMLSLVSRVPPKVSLAGFALAGAFEG
jgi:hypothetical protein